MYPVSDEFHTAVRNGNKQKALLIFKDAVFTDTDINIDRGIEFRDYFNADDSLKIGQVLSNEISFGLFNDNRYLNNYKFGDFLATLGVKVAEDRYMKQGDTMIRTPDGNTYIGQSEPPYLLRNGNPIASQPEFAIASLLYYYGKVWAFSRNGQYKVYSEPNGLDVTSGNPVNAFMRAKAKNWIGYGYVYNKTSRRLLIYFDGKREIYEFCPLGYFIGERPNAPDVIEIGMTCYDFMQRFEIDMPSASALGVTYPITLKNLLKKLCAYVNLPLKTQSFINENLVVSSEPEDFENSTMRTVIGWIAEAAASNARIDRDGNLILDWIRNTSQRIDESNYSDFEPYWYETKKVTKLYNRDTSNSDETIVGRGNECYLIQDNPFLNQ